MASYKPIKPLQQGEDYIYPLTTADQVIKSDGTRLDAGNGVEADKLSTPRTIRTSLDSTSIASFDGSEDVTPGVIGTLSIANGGTGATTAADALNNLGAAADDHTHHYAGSSDIGGAATSADKLSTARTIEMTGDVTGSGSFDGSADLSIAATIPNRHRIHYQVIPTNSDLNNYTTPGFYYSKSASNVISNKPSTFNGSFELIVTTSDTRSTAKYCSQIIKTYKSNEMYVRTNYNGTWLDWNKFSLDGHGHNNLQYTGVDGSLLTFAANCPIGVTPFSTGASTTDLPAASGYSYSIGWVHKRTSTQYTVTVQDYVDGSLMTNCYIDTSWQGWKSPDARRFYANIPHPGDQTSGFCKIRILDKYSSWMLSFKLRVYQSYVPQEWNISGYNYGTSNHWYLPKAKLITTDSGIDSTIYFGYDSDNILWIGFPCLRYSALVIDDIISAYCDPMGWSRLFAVSYQASLTGTLQHTVKLAGKMLQSQYEYGTTLPAAGNSGRIFFKKA